MIEELKQRIDELTQEIEIKNKTHVAKEAYEGVQKMMTEKQQEWDQKEKEFNKLKEKSKTIIVNENPKTIRDKMIALLAEQ